MPDNRSADPVARHAHHHTSTPAASIALTLPSSATIFAEHGELAFLATLSKAAYHLVAGEVVGGSANDPSGTATDAYDAVAGELKLLTASDLPALAPVATSDANFPFTGIVDGAYVSGNAAALIGVAGDALFVAFRGTNSASDQAEWTPAGLQNHFARFAALEPALATYLDAHPEITKLYVTGHSLGAAMVQPFIASIDGLGLDIEAATFATPGYSAATTADPSLITNFWTDSDIILLPEAFLTTVGDRNKFVDGFSGAVDSHAIDLYLAIVSFMHNEGIDLADLRKLHGVDYDSIVMKVGAAPAYAPGAGADTLAGTAAPDLMLGGAGNDSLDGAAGKDTLLGGADGDTLAGGLDKDWLAGGLGNDSLAGGGGEDTFFFAEALGAANLDHVIDFARADDAIDLDRGIFAGLKLGGLVGTKFFAKAFGDDALAKAHDASDRILYNKSTGTLFFDPDGKHGVAATAFAVLDGAPVIKAGDFHIDV